MQFRYIMQYSMLKNYGMFKFAAVIEVNLRRVGLLFVCKYVRFSKLSGRSWHLKAKSSCKITFATTIYVYAYYISVRLLCKFSC